MYIDRYVTVNNKKLHFYMMGSGPALILLHPSPSSGETMLPLAKQLSSNYTVLCVDTPGYGKSDALAVVPYELSAYTDFFHEAFKKLGLEKPAIYGSATGAQLAVRYGLEYPDSVSHIFLDNAAHFDDASANEIIEHYFPDLTPRLDGGHLTQIWSIVSQMFQYFPWCFTTKKYALNRPQMPLFVLQMVAMDYLKAGATYDIAYRLAFQHERGRYVQRLKVPTTIFRWENSIITKYVDQLLAFEFKDHVQPFVIKGDAEERNQKMVSFILGVSERLTDYKARNTVMEEVDSIILEYIKPMENPPEIQQNGQHFQEAWQLLLKNNPNVSAEEAQMYLVDWYKT
ncbi:alpha/beta hydrolase [Costertonia aggregata]|uniref:Alpha/beta hydrolase n=1 Tax=Costertonia aggregata TaxID=343403 RepID=A0A7H9ANM7_9FLAO|nr:alpha/beta fold hydrolase [Costertonia aggregata]QLG45059.1 alpha/beta hydrolase [Costertonia aggregata]